MRISQQTRARIAQLASNPRELARALPVVCRASHQAPVLAMLAADGTELTKAKREELLAKAVAGEMVELRLRLRAYEQKRGEQNRNFVRFRDGAMKRLGHSGKGNPFLRDHAQNTVLARAGTITHSATEKIGDGEYAIDQDVTLTAPWAVELALRGLLGSVSIGWNPTGPIMCSECDAPILTKCWHFPGDRLKVDEQGKKRYDDLGELVVEWIFTEAELIETSAVNVPGVPTARIDEIRACLSHSVPDLEAVRLAGVEFTHTHEDTSMPEELLKLLGLAATASASEVIAAVQAMVTAAGSDKAKLAIVETELGKFREQISALQSAQRQTDEDKFIRDALDSGRIALGDETMWRNYFKADATRAREDMAKREANAASPVGAPTQRANEPKDDEPAPAVLDVRESHISGGGIPGFTLYAVGERSKVERKEIARQLAAAVKALETHANPQARWWAQRMGYEGRIRGGAPTTLSATSIANNVDLDAARTAFRAAFMQSLEMAPVSPMELLFQTVPTNTPLAQINWMGDLPGFEEWIGDRKLSGVEAFKLSLQSKKWANGLRIKNDDVKFDNLGLMPAQIGGLATKGKRHRIDRMAGFMIDGFAGGATSNGLAYDGAFFFADSHRGGNDNKMAVALDAAGLTAADLLLESMTTYDGNDALDVHGSHLIVGPKLRATAEKLLTQERLANGEDNYHRGKYKLIVENRFRGAADDYWFLGDLTHEIKPFIYQLVEDITTSAVVGQENNQSMPSFMNDELLFGAQGNYNMAYFEFRLLVGSVL